MLMPNNIESDATLLQRLRTASHPITKRELTSQRVSFIYGNLPEGSTITREQIEARITYTEGLAA